MNTTRIVRTSPAAVIVFSVLFLALPIAGIKTILSSTHQEWAGIFLCALYPVVVYWVSSPPVHLTDTTLTYKTMLSTRSVRIDRLTHIEVAVSQAPVLRLFASREAKPLEFAIKPFSKNGVSYIIHHLRLSAPNAEFNPLSQELERGDFGAIVRETLKTRNLVRFAIMAGVTMLVMALGRAIFRK